MEEVGTTVENFFAGHEGKVNSCEKELERLDMFEEAFHPSGPFEKICMDLSVSTANLGEWIFSDLQNQYCTDKCIFSLKFSIVSILYPKDSLQCIL